MQFTVLEMVAVLVAIGFVIGIVYFVRLTKQVRKTAAELEQTLRRVTELTPAAQRLLANGESELEELRRLTQHTSQVAGHVNAITGEASAATLQLLRGLEHNVLDRVSAVGAGARAGFAALRNGRDAYDSSHAAEDYYDTTAYEEERMEGRE
jgi:hypothetical protein